MKMFSSPGCKKKKKNTLDRKQKTLQKENVLCNCKRVLNDKLRYGAQLQMNSEQQMPKWKTRCVHVGTTAFLGL